MPFTEIKVVSCDIGGTLVRSPRGPITGEIARLLGIGLPEARAYLGRAAKRSRSAPAELARQVAERFGRPGAVAEIEELLHRGRSDAEHPTLHDDVPTTLAELRRRGYLIVFFTNIVGASAPLTAPALYELADQVFCSCDIGHVKPEPLAFDHVRRALREPGRRVLHVGDSMGADVTGALRAGWQAAHVVRSPSGRQPEPAWATTRDGGYARVSGLAPLLELLPRTPVESTPPERRPVHPVTRSESAEGRR